MLIRPARWEDGIQIGELWVALVDYHRGLDPAMPIAAEDGAIRYASRVMSQLDNPLHQTFVAESEGVLVGYVTGMILDLMPEMFLEDRAGMVGDIFVVAHQRGQGVGKGLLNAMEDWFRLRDVTYYEWYVASRNEEGKAFWRTNGGRDVMIRMRTDLT